MATAVGVQLEREEATARSRFWTAGWCARAALAGSLVVFLVGFVLGLDPGGGSRSDFYTYHLPAILAFRNGALTMVLRDYSSATTPLFHILASYSPLLGSDTAFRASSGCLSLLICGLYILLLRRRFRDTPDVHAWSLLAGAALLLSPYFESTTYWPITDTLPLLFLLLTAGWMPEGADAGSGRIALLALGSAAAFYTRQNYVFLPVYTCAVLLAGQRGRRMWTALCFGVASLPGFYLARLWHGFTPPSFQEHHQGFTFSILVYPLTLIAFYAWPLLGSRPVPPMLRSRVVCAVCGACGLAFLGLLHGFSFAAHPLGGGIAVKLFAKLGRPGALFFLLLAYAGVLILAGLLHRGTWRTRLLIPLALLPALMLKFVYQRYYDPLLVMLFFLFVDRRLVRPFVSMRTGWAMLVFALALLGGASLYHGKDSGSYPIYSKHRPWEGLPPRAAFADRLVPGQPIP